MEYADQTLAQLLPRRALSPDETREMLIPALSALNFLHRNGLVQGQVKPTNLLVVGDHLKLASDTIRPAGKLSSGILRASLHDPPELKDGEIGPAGDIWGLGVTLVEALTQHPPSWPDSKAETVALTASIPPLFVDTVRRCLNRIPSARPTAGELEGQFNPAVHAHPITVVAAEEPVYEVSTVSTASNDASTSVIVRKGSGGGVLVLGVAAVLVLGLAVWVSRTIFVGQVEPSAARTAAVAKPSAPAVAAVADPPAPPASTADDVSSERIGSAEADVAREMSSEHEVAEDAGTGSTGRSESGDTGPAGAASSVGATSARVAPAYAGALTAPASVATGRSAVAAAPAAGASSTAAVAAGAAAASGFAATAPNADLSAQSPDIVGSVLHQQLPDIPRNIREKIRGHVNVTVRVLVDPSGNVVGEFLENAGPSRYFAHQAGDAAIDWKFVRSDGHGPRVWMLKFEFTRAGTTVRAVGTQ
jgi:outer membrane biosynthesis protein TonB